jgi:hypothetical protein
MIPGIKGQSELTKIPLNETGEQRVASPKKRDTETVVRANTEKLQSYGAVHLGSSVATLEPKLFRGGGGILNNNMAKPQNRYYSPDEHQGQPSLI